MDAAIVGVLFIIATVSGIIAASIGNPILDSPDYLAKISANEGTIIIRTFLVFVIAISCAGIGVGLYPILRNFSSHVVPAALSLWGLITIFPLLIGTLATTFGYQLPFIIYLPYVPFEFVIGVWILVKGISNEEHI
jgi:hypothetical protein